MWYNFVVISFPLFILTAIFTGGSGLASTRMSPFQILLELKTMELAAKTGARTCAKLHRHHQHTDTQFFTGQMPSLSPNQQEGHLACKKLGVGTLLVTI